MPGGSATKPGDVLTIRNGKTIEVLNTDAEGRLVLADGLALAVEAEPDAIIDLATLTGAAVVALGKEIAGLLGNDERLLAEVRAAGERAGEPTVAAAAARRLPGPHRLGDRRHAQRRPAGPGRRASPPPCSSASSWATCRGPTSTSPARPRSDENSRYLTKGGTGFGVRTLVALVTSESSPGRWRLGTRLSGTRSDGAREVRPMRIAVLGAGSWGTTVASLVAPRHDTVLWARNADVAKAINVDHANASYLPGFDLPPELSATSSLEDAVCDADLLIVGVPTSGFRGVLEEASPCLRPWIPVVSLSKGLETGHPSAHDRGHQGGGARPPGGGPDRAQHRPRDHVGQGRRRGGGHRGPRSGPGHPDGGDPGRVPRLSQRRRHRLRDGGRAEERHRHRRRDRRGTGRGGQHPRRGDVPRPGRAGPARRGHGRPAHNVRRTGRDG